MVVELWYCTDPCVDACKICKIRVYGSQIYRFWKITANFSTSLKGSICPLGVGCSGRWLEVSVTEQNRSFSTYLTHQLWRSNQHADHDGCRYYFKIRAVLVFLARRLNKSVKIKPIWRIIIKMTYVTTTFFIKFEFIWK